MDTTYSQQQALNTLIGGCTMTEVDLATDADVVVTASPALLLGIYVNVVLSTHVVEVKNGADSQLTLPVDLAAGTKIDCHSAVFDTNITIESNDSATGKIVVFWRAK
ncbi:MAG TPA: hypothetical protein ENG81_01570 [Candidatus Bathyarchaeota archaeon]|nr:hypothetical protein [Candidatus Bathyarchaeota archaeon]